MSDAHDPDRIPSSHPAQAGSSAFAASAERDRFVTPDGVQLSGWWRRVLAFMVDGILIGVVSLLVALPMGTFQSVFLSLGSAARGDGFAGIDPLTLVGGAVTAIASGLYVVIGTVRYGRTVGKAMTGIRVRMRAEERRPTVGEATLRWAVQYAPAVLTSAMPGSILASAGGTFNLVDSLWPLWDRRRQALHDKAAGTCVVLA